MQSVKHFDLISPPGMSIEHGECLHIVNICTSEKYKLLLDCFVSGRSSKELLLRSECRYDRNISVALIGI